MAFQIRPGQSHVRKPTSLADSAPNHQAKRYHSRTDWMLDMSTTVGNMSKKKRDRTTTDPVWRRKKRCDLGYPVCTQCVRLNYKCNWEEPKPIVQETARPTTSLQSGQSIHVPFRLSRVPDPILFWVDDHSDNTSRSSRRHFLRYYAQTFTHLLTTNIENNSFLSSASLPVCLHGCCLH